MGESFDYILSTTKPLNNSNMNYEEYYSGKDEIEEVLEEIIQQYKKIEIRKYKTKYQVILQEIIIEGLDIWETDNLGFSWAGHYSNTLDKEEMLHIKNIEQKIHNNIQIMRKNIDGLNLKKDPLDPFNFKAESYTYKELKDIIYKNISD